MDLPNEQEIAERAYAIWESEGRPLDRNVEHWLTAERELNANRKSNETLLSLENASAPVRGKLGQAGSANRKPKVSVGKPKRHSRGGADFKPH